MWLTYYAIQNIIFMCCEYTRLCNVTVTSLLITYLCPCLHNDWTSSSALLDQAECLRVWVLMPKIYVCLWCLTLTNLFFHTCMAVLHSTFHVSYQYFQHRGIFCDWGDDRFVSILPFWINSEWTIVGIIAFSFSSGNPSCLVWCCVVLSWSMLSFCF